jgi:putative ATP-binding cassette transporter
MAAEILGLSEASMQARTGVQERVASEFVFTQTLFFLLLGAIVFIVPSFNPGQPETTVKVATAMLFLVGSLGALLQAVPIFARAESALATLESLKERLGDEPAVPPGEEVPIAGFETLDLEAVRFRYPATGDEPGFAVGPIDLSVRRGEVVFIVGGNGSGKSTFLKLLTGLYAADSGTIALDGRPIEAIGRARYRSAISIVFTDFHLFPELYGIAATPEETAARLDELGLGAKTSVRDGVFSTLDLSAGQRKRVALAVARLERRPILVLDEWAAEQDPSFRRTFYREILPAIAAQGVTVIAATHDDHYFDAADRVYRMEEGRLSLLPARTARA